MALRYGLSAFRELVEDPASRRAHKLTYYSSRFLIVGIVALIIVRWLS